VQAILHPTLPNSVNHSPLQQQAQAPAHRSGSLNKKFAVQMIQKARDNTITLTVIPVMTLAVFPCDNSQSIV
jgi:hypothetical protein